MGRGVLLLLNIFFIFGMLVTEVNVIVVSNLRDYMKRFLGQRGSEANLDLYCVFFSFYL